MYRKRNIHNVVPKNRRKKLVIRTTIFTVLFLTCFLNVLKFKTGFPLGLATSSTTLKKQDKY